MYKPVEDVGGGVVVMLTRHEVQPGALARQAQVSLLSHGGWLVSPLLGHCPLLTVLTSRDTW